MATITALRTFTDWRHVPADHPPCVYMLVDPAAPRAPKYLGASRSLRSRLRTYMQGAHSNNRPCDAWRAALRAEGRSPVLVVVTIADSFDAARQAEWRLMRRWARRGIALLSNPTMSIEEKLLHITHLRRCVA